MNNIIKRIELKKLLLLIGLLVLVLIFTLPYFWMIGSAFKSRSEIFANVFPMTWKTFVPVNPTLGNFKTLLFDVNFMRNIWNSLAVSVVTVSIMLVICSMISFVLAFLEFPGRKVFFILIMSTMLIPFEARMIPTFLVVQGLGLSDTFTALFLPWVADAFIIFLMKQHFSEIPFELYQSATIDGCSHFKVYRRIMLPNLKATLITAGFIKFIFAWDSFVWPLIIIRDQNKAVISVALANLFSDQDVKWELVFSGALLATIPIVVLFLFLQRHYVEGMTSSGLKG